MDQLRPLFNIQNEREDTTDLGFQKKVMFFNQGTKTGAAGTAIVSIAGSISSVDITDGGVGYTTATVSFGSTIGIGTTTQDVDSTLGFPDTGKLIMLDVDNQPVSLAYTGKTVNQFFETEIFM